jgi:hypothetical protein
LLTESLAALSDADDNLASFLVTADGDDDAATSATPTEVTDAEDVAVTALDALVAGDYTNASVNVRAALLGDQQTANATALTTAQTALTTAQTNVAAVTGLSAAITTLNSANDAVTAATAAVSGTSTIVANLSGALAAYNSANTSGVSVAADGVVTGLIVVNGTSGLLELATGITETTNPGITALLTASQAKETGDAELVSATSAAASALTVVNNLDLNTNAITAVEAVGNGMKVVTPADISAPTTAEIAQETAGLAGVATTTQSTLDAATTADTDAGTAVADAADALDAAVSGANVAELDTGEKIATGTIAVAADGTAQANLDAAGLVDLIVLNADGVTLEIASGLVADAGGLVDALIAASQTQEDADAAKVITASDLTDATTADTAADTAVSDFAALVATYDGFATTNPLTGLLATATTGVETAQTNIDDLGEALADLTAASSLVADMTALDDAITAAETAITDAGYASPVTLVTGTNFATAEDDIFLADSSVATSAVANFNLLGSDVLYVGTDFTLNEGVLATDGDNSVLEVFLSEVGGNAVITLETSVFSSNSTDAEAAITLTGVAMADVTIADGFVTVA